MTLSKQPSHINKSRRSFFKTVGLTSLSLGIPLIASASLRKLSKPVSIGMIADLHHDIMHDGEARLQAFLKEISTAKPDAIVQLGDFAYPNQKNKPLIDQFNQAQTTSLHVIGNHDTDSGHTKDQCLKIWGMKSRYYRQDIEGLRLLVLDGNDKGSPTSKGGYASYVGKEQIEWLKQELKKHDGPIVVICHQPLAGSGAVDNAEEIQKILGQHAEKVVICINGHTHIDSLVEVENVPYLHINSASYLWVGGKCKHASYSKEIHKKHPWIGHTCPYRDSLFTTITFDPRTGEVSVKGKKSDWVGKSPAQLKLAKLSSAARKKELVPMIRTRTIKRS